MATLVVGAGGLVFGAPGASAAVILTAVPTFPDPVAVGQTNVAAALSITNISTAPQGTDGFYLDTITLVPSCGAIDSTGSSGGSCNTGYGDPGVFQLSPTGIGQAGTACAGRTFTTSVIEPATGRVQFTPNAAGGPVVIGPPGSFNASCGIDFSFDVLKMPTSDGAPGTPGISTFQLGFVHGTSTNGSSSGNGSGADETQVLPQAQGVPLVAPQVAAVVLGPLALAGGLVGFRRRRRPV